MEELEEINESNKSLMFFRDVFLEIKRRVEEKYIDFLKSNNVTLEKLKEKPFWTYSFKKGVHAGKFALHVAISYEEKGHIKEIVSPSYFLSSKILEKFDTKNSNKDSIKVAALQYFLRFIGYDRKEFADQMEAFLEDLQQDEKVKKEIVLKQRKYLYKKFGKPNLLYGERLDLNKKQVIVKKFTDSVWRFYFFGYPSPEDKRSPHTQWLLVKLILSFKQSRNRYNLNVEIKNTDNTLSSRFHDDLVGQTDLDMSSPDVLVMNFTTRKYDLRQLNIKIGIPNLDGNVFLGQYLNYNEAGRIYSGSVLIEKIGSEAELENEEPQVYEFPEVESNPEEIKKIWPIAKFFQDEKTNFRGTPMNISTRDELLSFVTSKEPVDKQN